jgi:hypothetical protein
MVPFENISMVFRTEEKVKELTIREASILS